MREAYVDLPIKVRCQKCPDCLDYQKRSWAVRCAHEAALHERNCFVTLTYDDEHLPKDNNLNHEHWQKFAKRLRKRKGKFRFFMSGEYGKESYRPHYHALIFGHDFSEDRVLWKQTDAGNALYLSADLVELWRLGFAVIGNLSFASAAYVAKYITKRNLPTNGILRSLKPEYVQMSRRPGLGSSWFEMFKRDVYPDDHVVVDGMVNRPPVYYDRLLKEDDEAAYDQVLEGRRKWATERDEHRTWERLAVREHCKTAKYKATWRS